MKLFKKWLVILLAVTMVFDSSMIVNAADVSVYKQVYEQQDEPAAETPDETAAETPDEAPVENPDETPVEDPDETPVENPDETPVENPDETPVENPDETPVENPDETPVENPDETPVENPDETPVENPDETPVENPDEIPAEDPDEPQEEMVVTGFAALETTVITMLEKGTLEDVLMQLPATVAAQLQDGSAMDVSVVWTCDADYAATEADSYVFTASLADETLKVAEGVAMPVVTVVIAAEEATEALITAFLPLAVEEITLAEKAPLEEVTAQLPAAVKAEVEGAEEAVDVAVNWACTEDYEAVEADSYVFEAVLAEEGYAVAEDVAMPAITVSIVAQKMTIVSFSELTEEESNLYLSDKGTLEEVTAQMPAALEAVVADKDGQEEPASVEVTWTCEVDYEAVEAEEYVFIPVWDEEVYEAGQELLVPTIVVSMGQEISGASVNPLYQQLVTEEQLVAETEEELAEELNGAYYKTYDASYSSASALGTYLKKKMLSRNNATVPISFTYSTDSISTFKKAVEDAVYIYATADSASGNVKEGDYLLSTLLGYSYSGRYRYNTSTKRYDMTVTMDLIFLTTPSQENYITNRVNSILSSLSLGGKTEIQKILIINDWICDNVDYVPTSIYDPSREDVTTESAKAKRIYHTAYPALSEGYTVCQGYAALFYRMCKQSGLKVRYVTSTDHAWNIVKYGSAWYNIDTTWDGGSGVTYHDWFMKNMADFTEHPRDTLSARRVPTASYPMSKTSFGSGCKVASVTSTNFSTLTVKWSKVAGVDGYIVYRSTTSSTSGFAPVKTISSGNTVSLVDRGLTCGTTYYYKVQPILKNAKTGAQVKLPISAVKAGKPTLPTTTISSVKSVAYNSLQITWKQVTGASGYTVMRSTTANGTYTRVRSVAGGANLTYTDKGVTCGITYYYKILPYRTVNGKNVYAAYSPAKGGATVMGQAVLSSVTCPSYKSTLIKWQKTPGATGYIVYRSTNGKTYSKVGSVANGSTLSFTDTKSLVCGTTYYYKVRAYRTVNGKYVTGAYSNSRGRKVIPANTAITAIGKGGARAISLQWKKVDGATGYEIWRSTTASGTYTLVRNLSGVNSVAYKNTGLTAGKSYYYKIRAYRTVNGKKVYGNYSAAKGYKAYAN